MKILKRRHPHPEIPLVSTADVSFLLLIFFLSTTIFVTHRGISLELPRPGERAIVLPADKVARVLVRADRTIQLNGEVVAMGALGRLLETLLEARPDLLVRLSVDPSAPYAAMVQALDQVKLSGARQIAIQTGTEP
ncbi:MAG: biopolymer transporter ExbD [Candidatus Latescibacteria bacterium]|nr:biopolymer transporter ExbD [Candidatus Latescibacterota bacterium]